MTISALNNRLETMNRYIKYLPGTGDPLGEEEMRIALIDPLFNVNSEPESRGPSSEFYKLHISPVLISETF
jgi:hypothetical protein